MKGFTDKLTAICRGDATAIPAAIRGETRGWIPACLLTIVVGCALYGAAVGLWRDPLQAWFLAIKFPALIFATLIFNGALNGMLALVLGSGLGFRQTLLAILMSFATFAAILGALSPIAYFMILGAPDPDPGQMGAYRRFVLIHTAVIAYAGLVANIQMFGTLVTVTRRKAAVRTFVAWTAGNLFVGAQLAWNLRPFFGSPWGEICFLRPDAFEGSFYEAVFTMLLRQFAGADTTSTVLAAVYVCCLIGIALLVANAISKGRASLRGLHSNKTTKYKNGPGPKSRQRR